MPRAVSQSVSPSVVTTIADRGLDALIMNGGGRGPWGWIIEHRKNFKRPSTEKGRRLMIKGPMYRNFEGPLATQRYATLGQKVILPKRVRACAMPCHCAGERRGSSHVPISMFLL